MNKTNSLLSQKKGDYLMGQETFVLLYKLGLVVFLTVFIVAFVYAFFYKEYDVRQAEASILSAQIANCYIHNGVANIEDFDLRASKKCNVSAGKDYYADIYFESGFLEKDALQDGGENSEDVRVFCNVFTNGKRPKGDYFEGCLENEFNFVLNHEYDIKILADINGVNEEIDNEVSQNLENYYFKLYYADKVEYYKDEGGTWYKNKNDIARNNEENEGWEKGILSGEWAKTDIDYASLKKLGDASLLGVWDKEYKGRIESQGLIKIKSGFKKRVDNG